MTSITRHLAGRVRRTLRSEQRMAPSVPGLRLVPRRCAWCGDWIVGAKGGQGLDLGLVSHGICGSCHHELCEEMAGG